MKIFALVMAVASVGMVAACATPEQAPVKTEPPVSQADAAAAQQEVLKPETNVLKRKIAIGRFSNETRYGRTFLRDSASDPLGKQVSDMLAARLVDSGAFLVFERPDLEKLQRENRLSGVEELVGVDTLILGSLTEFGRNTVGQSGFFSSTMRQQAHAKVEIRLVEPKTGHVFFSASGQGEATNEADSTFGYGSRADYDASLNDKAIGSAVTDLMNSLVSKLKEKPWRTDILKVEGTTIYISGGERQGLKAGDRLRVMRAGERVKSGQTGFMISLPASPVAGIEVVSLFGTDETNEGAVCRLVSGSLPPTTSGLFVAEPEGGV